MNVRRPFEESTDVIVCGVEINRQNTLFLAACKDGYRVYDLSSSRLQCFREFDGALQFGTILGNSNIISLLGSRRGAPKDFHRGEVVLWDNANNTLISSLGDGLSKPLRVCISNDFYVPVCETGLAVFRFGHFMDEYDSNSLVKSYPTLSNPHGLAVLGNRFLIFPGIAKGKLQILNLRTMKSDIINAHTSSLRALALSREEEYIATVSERGTLVRVWSTRDLSRIMESRRGMDEAEVFGLAFSYDAKFLALTSDKGTLHVFGVPDTQGRETTLADVSSDVREDAPLHRRQVSDGSIAGKSIPSPQHRPRAHSTKISPSLLPPSSYGKRISPPNDPMTQSTLLSSSPTQVQIQGDDPGMWQHVPRIHTAGGKATRFQDIPPSATSQHSMNRLSTSPGSNITGYNHPSSPASIVGGPYSGRKSTTSSANTNLASPTSRYGPLANLPFAPRVLRDTYSLCKTSFHLPLRPVPPRTPTQTKPGGIPSAPVGAAIPRGPMTAGSLATGVAVKGVVGWCWDPKVAEKGNGQGRYEVVVISAGRGGRWEKWVLERTGLRMVGWKCFAEDEGGF